LSLAFLIWYATPTFTALWASVTGGSFKIVINCSGSPYHLSTAEIIELKESGVSEKIIDFMINTALQTAPRS
jgi:hypothetical protein